MDRGADRVFQGGERARFSPRLRLWVALAVAALACGLPAGETFIEAIENFHTAIAEGICQNDPAVLNMQNAKQQTGLHLGAEMNNLRIVKFILKRNPDLKIVDNKGNTALHAAVQGNNLEIVKLMVEHGADWTVKNRDGQTALDVARGLARQNMIDYLSDVAAGKVAIPAPTAPGSDPGGDALRSEIARNDLDAVRATLARMPAAATSADGWGRTPLFSAMSAKTEIADALLAQRADPNQVDRDRWRPLHLAAEAGRPDLVQLLLQHQADPNPVSDAGRQTPLYIAAVFGHTEVVKRLLAANANPNLNTSQGVSALHRAAEYGYIDIVSLLMLARADLAAKDQAGKTALDYAQKAQRADVVGLLVKAGAAAGQPMPSPPADNAPAAAPTGGPAAVSAGPKADPKAVLDPADAAAFLKACVDNDDATIRSMLKTNPSLIYARQANGNSPLYLLARLGNIETYRLILDLGLPVDVVGRNARTALHRTAEFGRLDLVKLLIERGAKINPKDADGCTPLHHSAKNANDEAGLQTLRFLLDQKADPTILDNDGLTPYGEAKKNGNQHSLPVLEAHGIKQ